MKTWDVQRSKQADGRWSVYVTDPDGRVTLAVSDVSEQAASAYISGWTPPREEELASKVRRAVKAYHRKVEARGPRGGKATVSEVAGAGRGLAAELDELVNPASDEDRSETD